MDSHRIRAACALLGALIAAALLKFVLIDIGALHITEDGASVGSSFWNSLLQVIKYGLPLGALAIGATEFLRVRRLDVQLAIGILISFIAGYLSTLGEPVTSPVFSGGALTALALLTVGAATSGIYWVAAGRQASWRGHDIEQAAERDAEAFRRASAQSQFEPCHTCLAGFVAAALAGFAFLAWILIDMTGLHGRVLAEVERQGHLALKNGGYNWARFSVFDERGVIEGEAPDELQKRAAYDIARETLSAATGFPGVLSRIEDKVAARVPMADVSRQLAEAKLREEQAARALEEARRVAEAARLAGSEAERRAAERAQAAEEELRVERERQQALRQKDDAQRQTEAAAQQVQKPDPVAAPEPAPREDAVAAVAAVAPTPEQVGIRESENGAARHCTEQDVAMVESSRIYFPAQTFEIEPGFERDLDRLAASIRACTPRPIQVTGYADASVDRLFNPALGLQRAEAIQQGLIARGIAATRVVAKTPPPTLIAEAPVDDNAAYRRADFKFLEFSELSRDATQKPDERAVNCERDLKGIMERSVIHFPTASARVSPESMGLIYKLASAIQNCGSVIVTVEGHTDKVGSIERNQQLSEARAYSVREALVTYGADPTRLASRGFASLRPYDESETAEAYALNRRIEFRVSGKFTTTSAGGP